MIGESDGEKLVLRFDCFEKFKGTITKLTDLLAIVALMSKIRPKEIGTSSDEK